MRPLIKYTKSLQLCCRKQDNTKCNNQRIRKSITIFYYAGNSDNLCCFTYEHFFFFRTEQSLYTTNSLMTHFNKVMDVFFALLKEMDNY